MRETKVFPNFWQALLYNYIVPLVIFLLILFFIFKGVIPDVLFTINANFSHLLTIPILLFFLWKSEIKITWVDFVNLNVKKIFIVIILTAGIEMFFYGTSYLFENLFNRHYPPFQANNKSCISLVQSIIIAPIIEEMLYRRIFLHQFLHQYSSWLAIVLSSILFVVPHVPVMIYPELFVPYLFSGLFLGLVYYKTKSISLCIVSHSVMNIITYFI